MAYCTTADVKDYLGISGTGDDTLIGTLVTAAQEVIDSHAAHVRGQWRYDKVLRLFTRVH